MSKVLEQVLKITLFFISLLALAGVWLVYGFVRSEVAQDQPGWWVANAVFIIVNFSILLGWWFLFAQKGFLLLLLGTIMATFVAGSFFF